ncbi:MAG: alpha/beta fold hydrolase [Caulobacteraceae bacterium]
MDDGGQLPRRTTTPLAPLGRPPQAAVSSDRAMPLFADLDRRFHAAEGQLTSGGSPLALWLASVDWAAHMANAPFRRSALGVEAGAQWLRFWQGALGGDSVQPSPGDHRFGDPQWKALPFNLYEQAFLLMQEWMETATKGVPGVNPENERLVNFAARQWLDIFSPSNSPWINPEVLRATTEKGGQNFVEGLENFMADLAKVSSNPEGEPDSGLKVGRDLAVTPGQVVFCNDLIELIQYSPQTGTVRAEPVLITPAWIMKYYILDLSPHNSLIRYLVEQGYTVFCISWRNPGADLRDVPFDAYRSDGLMTAIDAVSAIRPGVKIHACGYCLGGTLLAIGAATMARDGDDRLADITLFCAQTDFTEAGELQLFTTEEQVSFLEDVMARQGYLDGRQMGSAFELLRSRDLIWSRLLKSYWLGEKDQPNDLMTWNDDATRMPARMHSEYLRTLFLRNDLAEGRLLAGGRAISIGDIRAPLFVVSTETDHVAPWRSVYKINLLNEGEVTFVLTTGGHNAGIVSEPGHPHRSFHIQTRAADAGYVGPDEWAASAERREGSWWLAWQAWLDARSGAQDMAPPTMGATGRGYAPLRDAPGKYVLER